MVGHLEAFHHVGFFRLRRHRQVASSNEAARNGQAALQMAQADPRDVVVLPGVEIMSIVETAPPAPVGYASEAMQQLREAIQHLPPEENEVFLLRQNGELTYEQIAQLDNRPVEVVKEQMRSAIRKLRTVVQEVSLGNHARCVSEMAGPARFSSLGGCQPSAGNNSYEAKQPAAWASP